MDNTSDISQNPSESTGVDGPREFYNRSKERGLDHRNSTKLIQMRKFHNWIKSTLINEYLGRVRRESSDPRQAVHVFDMGCGKGGDQPKWQIGRVSSVTFADLAENSVRDCEKRYKERRAAYKAKFFSLDCTTELVRDKIDKDQPQFDLVSSQFVLHYSFGNLESADRFLRNAAEFLREGGFFIGTTVNSCQLVKLCREAPDQTIANDVFSVKFDPSVDLNTTSNESIPLFGVKYHFNLDELVDCPEYLVYFPLLKHLAEKHGLEEVDRKTFKDYFTCHSGTVESRRLMNTMTALEYYELPKDDDANHQRGIPVDQSQYTHARHFITEFNRTEEGQIQSCRTLSKQEWDISSLYITFAFQKRRTVNYDDAAVAEL